MWGDVFIICKQFNCGVIKIYVVYLTIPALHTVGGQPKYDLYFWTANENLVSGKLRNLPLISLRAAERRGDRDKEILTRIGAEKREMSHNINL